jgi:hypothetical protein
MLDEPGWSRPVSMNRRDLDQLERRELQMTVTAAAVILILAAALALFLYPLVFVHPDENNKWTVRAAFVGFCVLTLLFVVYLFDRQRTVAKLKQQVIEELERNIELRVQACADLLQTMPDANHFWDRLAMEFHRALTMQRTLSLLLVKVKPGPRSLDEADNAKAWADAAPAPAHRFDLPLSAPPLRHRAAANRYHQCQSRRRAPASRVAGCQHPTRFLLYHLGPQLPGTRSRRARTGRPREIAAAGSGRIRRSGFHALSQRFSRSSRIKSYARACFRSAMRSSESSMPIDTRTHPGTTPASASSCALML